MTPPTPNVPANIHSSVHMPNIPRVKILALSQREITGLAIDPHQSQVLGIYGGDGAELALGPPTLIEDDGVSIVILAETVKPFDLVITQLPKVPGGVTVVDVATFEASRASLSLLAYNGTWFVTGCHNVSLKTQEKPKPVKKAKAAKAAKAAKKKGRR